jgi:UPF0716 protein FxsA
LLLTPGFFTDAVGFALLVPGIRRAAFQAMRSRVNVSGSMNFDGEFTNTNKEPHRPMQGDVIDGEYHELSEDEKKAQRPSGWTKH